MGNSLNKSFNEDLFYNIVARLNLCFIRYYKRLYPKSIQDFRSCCRPEEIDIIKRAIAIAKQHTSYSNKVIYSSVIIYYYNVIVIEYYIGFSEGSDALPCYRELKKEYGPEVDILINRITTSDEVWASQIRRLINNLSTTEPFSGGKFKRGKTKKRKRKRNTKSKSKKLK